MEVVFLEDAHMGNRKYLKGEKIKSGERCKIEDLNKEYLLFVIRGIRYDIKKSSVKILSK